MSLEKNIWIFCHYAQQPPFNTMLRYHNWGKYIQNHGYKVTIVAASTVHNTSIDILRELNDSHEEFCDGVRYLYIRTPQYSGNGLSRIRNMLSYSIGIRKFKKGYGNPDCIIICGAYLFPFSKHFYKRIPIVCDIVDLWPLSIVEYTTVSEKNIFIRCLYRIEQMAFIRCDALVFSMEGGVEYVSERTYAKRVNVDKIFHINMGCDIAEFDRNFKNIIKLQEAKRKEQFIITYAGSIRQANHIIQICEAAKILQENGYSKIMFRFFGNGSGETEAKSFCKKNKLENVEFFGRFEKARIPIILSESSANIMTYKQSRVMKYGGSQSKLFDYLASGKPIINCGDWGYNLVSRYKCGIIVEEITGGNIAEAVRTLYEMPKAQLQEMGYQARKVAEIYDQPRIVEKLCEVIGFVLPQL